MIWTWEDVPRSPAERQQDLQQPGTREAETRRKFFKEHSPIYAMRANEHYKSASLFSLTRQLEVFIRRLGQPHADNILSIDKTAPSIDPQEISYRYPFQVGHQYMAPADYPSQDWNLYQGDTLANLIRSVERLHQNVISKLRSLR
jgi:hypothetical protein